MLLLMQLLLPVTATGKLHPAFNSDSGMGKAVVDALMVFLLNDFLSRHGGHKGRVFGSTTIRQQRAHL